MKSRRVSVLGRQGWHCEACDTAGLVRVTKGNGVWDVIRMIESDHVRASPNCPAPVRTIRVYSDGPKALKYPRRPRLFFGTYGTHRGAPCLWGTKDDALENKDQDERVYEFRVEMIREVKS
jgi:hypothetical protein